MGSRGFITIDRAIDDWRWRDNNTALGLWIHILLSANWKSGWFMGHEIPRGSFATSMRRMAEDTGLSEKTIRKWLKRFEEDKQIEIRGSNKYTLIKVINYAKFQDYDPENPGQRYEQSTEQSTEQGTEQSTEQRLDNRNNKQYKQRNKETIETIICANDPQIVDNEDAWFRVFWDTYPKHKAKDAAQKAFRKVCRSSEDFNQILAGLKNVIENEWSAKDPQFIPYPSTWLNQHRWMDDITPRKKTLDDIIMEEHEKNEQRTDSQDPENNLFGVWWK